MASTTVNSFPTTIVWWDATVPATQSSMIFHSSQKPTATITATAFPSRTLTKLYPSTSSLLAPSNAPFETPDSNPLQRLRIINEAIAATSATLDPTNTLDRPSETHPSSIPTADASIAPAATAAEFVATDNNKARMAAFQEESFPSTDTTAEQSSSPTIIEPSPLPTDATTADSTQNFLENAARIANPTVEPFPLPSNSGLPIASTIPNPDAPQSFVGGQNVEGEAPPNPSPTEKAPATTALESSPTLIVRPPSSQAISDMDNPPPLQPALDPPSNSNNGAPTADPRRPTNRYPNSRPVQMPGGTGNTNSSRETTFPIPPNPASGPGPDPLPTTGIPGQKNGQTEALTAISGVALVFVITVAAGYMYKRRRAKSVNNSGNAYGKGNSSIQQGINKSAIIEPMPISPSLHPLPDAFAPPLKPIPIHTRDITDFQLKNTCSTSTTDKSLRLAAFLSYEEPDDRNSRRTASTSSSTASTIYSTLASALRQSAQRTQWRITGRLSSSSSSSTWNSSALEDDDSAHTDSSECSWQGDIEAGTET